MFLINQAMVNVPIGTAALIVVLGMAVVFFGLILPPPLLQHLP